MNVFVLILLAIALCLGATRLTYAAGKKQERPKAAVKHQAKKAVQRAAPPRARAAAPKRRQTKVVPKRAAKEVKRPVALPARSRAAPARRMVRRSYEPLKPVYVRPPCASVCVDDYLVATESGLVRLVGADLPIDAAKARLRSGIAVLGARDAGTRQKLGFIRLCQQASANTRECPDPR